MVDKMAMEFDKLTLNEKANLIWEKGKLLATGEYYSQRINLYTMYGKLYEVWYDVNENRIAKIQEMKDGRLFRKYFKKN